MDQLIYLAAIILLALICYAFYRLHQYRQEKELFDLVAWCVTTDYQSIGSVRPGLDLCHYIGNAQVDQKLPSEYCIHGDTEWQFTKEILKEYQRDLTQSYFNSSLSPKAIKSKYSIHGDHYFMFSLCSFLGAHQCEYEFLGHDMHQERLVYKSYGHMCFDATYSLSDFAIVYHKLYYIVYNSCKESKIFNPNEASYQHPDDIKKILDTKQIEISRYN